VLIFALFVVATIMVWEPALDQRHVLGALGLGIVSVPVHVALSPFVLADITTYSPGVQMSQYGVTLTLLTAVIAALMLGRRDLESQRAMATLAGIGLTSFVVIFLGRRATMTLDPALDYLYLVAAAALLGLFAVGIQLTRTAPTRH